MSLSILHGVLAPLFRSGETQNERRLIRYDELIEIHAIPTASRLLYGCLKIYMLDSLACTLMDLNHLFLGFFSPLDDYFRFVLIVSSTIGLSLSLSHFLLPCFNNVWCHYAGVCVQSRQPVKGGRRGAIRTGRAFTLQTAYRSSPGRRSLWLFSLKLARRVSTALKTKTVS